MRAPAELSRRRISHAYHTRRSVRFICRGGWNFSSIIINNLPAIYSFVFTQRPYNWNTLSASHHAQLPSGQPTATMCSYVRSLLPLLRADINRLGTNVWNVVGWATFPLPHCRRTMGSGSKRQGKSRKLTHTSIDIYMHCTDAQTQRHIHFEPVSF